MEKYSVSLPAHSSQIQVLIIFVLHVVLVACSQYSYLRRVLVPLSSVTAGRGDASRFTNPRVAASDFIDFLSVWSAEVRPASARFMVLTRSWERFTTWRRVWAGKQRFNYCHVRTCCKSMLYSCDASFIREVHHLALCAWFGFASLDLRDFCSYLDGHVLQLQDR